MDSAAASRRERWETVDAFFTAKVQRVRSKGEEDKGEEEEEDEEEREERD